MSGVRWLDAVGQGWLGRWYVNGQVGQTEPSASRFRTAVNFFVFWLAVVAYFVVFGSASYLIARGRDGMNAKTWFLGGAVFGPVGVLLALIAAHGQAFRRLEIILVVTAVVAVGIWGSLAGWGPEAGSALLAIPVVLFLYVILRGVVHWLR
jgi:hypothetical protein